MDGEVERRFGSAGASGEALALDAVVEPRKMIVTDSRVQLKCID